MGFFSDKGQFSGAGGDFPVAEDGVYLCRLKEIIAEQRPSFENPDVMVDQFRFSFETIEEADENGAPYRFVKFTGVKYGNDKANLTKTLDSMLGRRLTPDEFNDLDLEDLTAKKWRVCVEQTTSGKGSAINKISWVKPQATKPQNVATAANAPRTAPAAAAPGGTRGAGPIGDFDGEDPFEENEPVRGRGVSASAL